ncbi:hypothetical protein PM8797T_02549 [Gimesia maris DSM 8797]|nr:hypothetical protein PM8797T_02549 [Gimesia maris DSM 8797]
MLLEKTALFAREMPDRNCSLCEQSAR